MIHLRNLLSINFQDRKIPVLTRFAFWLLTRLHWDVADAIALHMLLNDDEIPQFLEKGHGMLDKLEATQNKG